MKIEAKRVQATEIDALRQAYRAEAQCQIIYDSFLPRGHADAYAVSIDDRAVGYGALANRYYPRQVIEFYVVPKRASTRSKCFAACWPSLGPRTFAPRPTFPS